MKTDALKLARQVHAPTRVFRSDWRHGTRGGVAVIPILGMDPRLVLQASIWVTRSTDAAGSTGEHAGAASGVTWSLYAARKGADQQLRPIIELEGFKNRVVRGVEAWRADGMLACGDGAEISACGDLLLVIRAADIYGTLDGDNQEVWVGFDVHPSDALRESTEEGQETYRGLVEQLRVAVPDVTPLLVVMPG